MNTTTATFEQPQEVSSFLSEWLFDQVQTHSTEEKPDSDYGTIGAWINRLPEGWSKRFSRPDEDGSHNCDWWKITTPEGQEFELRLWDLGSNVHEEILGDGGYGWDSM